MAAETVISVSDETVRRLKALAEPLEDTYDSVISRLLDAYDGKKMAAQSPPKARPNAGGAALFDGHECDPFAPPSLTHTKVTSASINGEQIERPNWSKLLDRVLTIAMKRSGSFSEVQRIVSVNLYHGKKIDEGYHYLADVGFSVQGQDANDAWRGTAQICRTIGLDAEVHFLWRLKDGAALPGRNGLFRMQPRG
jgi:hypothetical protein